MEKEVGNDHADKLALPISQYLCQFVFLIIQIDKRLGDDLLIFDRQGGSRSAGRFADWLPGEETVAGRHGRLR